MSGATYAKNGPPVMSRIVVDQMMPTIPSRRWPFQQGCHLFHLDNDVAALDQFARGVGLSAHWRHDAPRFPHYDLTPSMRCRAIELGAIEIDPRGQEMREYLNSRRRELSSDVGNRT